MARINVRGVDWHVARTGTGQDVVFIHGFQNAGSAWTPLLAAMADDPIRASVVDLPGCGDSEPPPTWERSTIPELAADLATILDGPAVIVGHSLGGGIALQLALDAPDLAKGLLLFAPVSTRGLDFVDGATAEALAHPTAETQRALLRAAFHRLPDDETMATLLATIERAHPLHIEGAARSMRTFVVEDRLGEIRCPTLLVAGDRDRHVPLRNHLATWSALPRAGLHVEHDVGHVPFVEAPETSARLLRGLLAQAARS